MLRGKETKRETAAPRCIAKLIEAIDSAHFPPIFKGDMGQWLQHWRAREKELYSDSEKGARAAKRLITVTLIRSLVTGREYRKKDAEHHERQRVRRNLGRRLPAGVLTVQRNVNCVISMGEASMEEWALSRFRTVDIFAEENNDYLRLRFKENDKGYFKINFYWKTPPYYIRCGSILTEMGIKAGHYRFFPVDKGFSEYVIEFADGPIEIRHKDTH